VQFRPVGAECLGDELAQEGAEFCEGLCLSGAAVRRGMKRCRTDRSHDAGLLFLLAAAKPRETPFLAPGTTFRPIH
jgi:hypothetical protein